MTQTMKKRKITVKRIQKLPKKAPKSPKPVDIGPEDSDDYAKKENQVLRALKLQPELVNIDPNNSDNETLEVDKNKKSQSLEKGYTEAKKYYMLPNLIPSTSKKC